MDAFHREVAHPCGPEGAAVADPVAQDPPGEEGISFVLPGCPHDLPVIMGLHKADPEGDRAHAFHGFPSAAGGHVPRKRGRLIFLLSVSRNPAKGRLHWAVLTEL